MSRPLSSEDNKCLILSDILSMPKSWIWACTFSTYFDLELGVGAKFGRTPIGRVGPPRDQPKYPTNPRKQT